MNEASEQMNSEALFLFCIAVREPLIVIVMNIMSLTVLATSIVISVCTAAGFCTIMGIATVYHRVFLITASVLAAPVAATIWTTFFCFKITVTQGTFTTVTTRIRVIAVIAIRIVVVVAIVIIAPHIILR